MAGIKLGMGFERTGAFPIDETLTLTKAQMLTVQDNMMPDKYMTVCLDDGKIYLYDKSAVPDPVTGKFKLADTSQYDDTPLKNRLDVLETGSANTYTKSETDAKIAEELRNFDKLDYKKADAIPTSTKVIINGAEEDVVPGVRYLVKDSTENRFYEYVVLEGVVYNMGPASSGGSSELSSELEVTNPIGKYAQGEKIPERTSTEAILRGMLSKTYYPNLTGPRAILTFSAPTLAKVGQTINGGAATSTLNRGLIDPQYTAASQYRSGEATGYSISITGAENPYTDSNDTGAFTLPAFTKNSKGSVVIATTIEYAAGVQPKDSDGENYSTPLDAGSVSDQKAIEFILPFVHGASAAVQITDFTGFTEDLKKSGNKSYAYTTNNEHPVIGYDASYGDLKSILDQNGFETIGGWTKTNVTVEGQLYSVYVHDNATTDTGATFTFKF